MKTIRFKHSVLGACTALALAGFLDSAQAQFTPNVDSYTNTFDTSAGVAKWVDWFNWTATMSLDSTVYAPTPAGNAGSMKIDLESPWAQPVTPQMVLFQCFNGAWDNSVTINANLYTNIIFDIFVSSNDVVNPNGNFGGYYVGFVPTSFDSGKLIQVGFVPIPAEASNHWVHCVLPIPKTLSGDISGVCGVYFQMTHWWDQDPAEPPAAGLTDWIDNLEVEITPGPPPPPPTLLSSTIKKAVAGVNCIAVVAGSPAIDNRYSVCTTNTAGYGPNSGDTVTYSWNIASFPNDPNGFQAHFFITCGADSSLTPNSNGGPGPYDSADDWNWGNVIYVAMQANADGAYMNFRYKTNAPNSGSQFSTNYCTVNSSSPIGPWSVSFNRSSGLVTLTSPTATTNFTMDLPSLALFTDPLALTLGGQANDLTGEGQSVVYSSFTATGCATPISDNFATDTQLNTNIWFALAGDVTGVQPVPPTAGLWLTWTRPDGGFSPQTSGSLLTTFADVTPITTLLDMGNRMILIPQSELQGANQNFFRLIQRTFTKLQILLPGETAAPNTPSGKTGTPIAQANNVEFNVTVNAVDDTWHLVSSSDTVELTDPDANFIVTYPISSSAQSLSGGTATFTVEFFADGTSAITAQDTTDNTKTSATSATITY